MILYINTIITDVRNQGIRYNRYGLPGYDRLDIFKYSLASLAALNKHWSKVVMYVELEGRFGERWPELEAFVRLIFSGIRISIHRYRNFWQFQWQEAYIKEMEPVSDNLIWYHGNDDHIFIDYDMGCIDDILELMYQDYTPFVSCMYSHWPEYIRFSAHNRCYNAGPASVFNSHNTDAIHIISKGLYKHWFWDHKWWGSINRTDFIKFSSRIDMKCYVPHRELVRHFDGYSHSMHLQSVCPPLHIPDGFFKRNIKIAYCGTKREFGWTLVNPLMPYRTVIPEGADYCYTLKEIPLFWRDRISQIKVVNRYPERALYEARNAEKWVMLDPAVRWGNKWMPTVPWDWMCPYLFLRPHDPKLL